MIHHIEYIRDSIGNNYLGVNIYPNIVEPFLDKLKTILGDNFDEYHKYKMNRDHDKYHITVMNVMEYNDSSKKMGMDKFINSLDAIFKFEIDDIKLMGIGTAKRNENQTYFIVVNSEKLQEIRKKYNLPEYDFHITIGFRYKDVFGVRKNEIIQEYDPFLKLLKKYYYNGNENFDFIKDVENFDLDKEKDIYPIEINNTNIQLRIGDIDYITVSLIDDKLWITSKWQDKIKKPIIPTTIISKKLNNI